MTRASLAALALLAAPACNQDPSTNAPVRSRVEVVAPDAGAAVDRFCEVSTPADEAPWISYPGLDSAPPARGQGWTWVSLWATWCGPCIEELPLLRAWQEDFAAQGLPFGLHFLSVDADAAELARQRAARKGLPAGPRVLDQAEIQPWLAAMGLEAPASVPIHILADPAGLVRCIRVGAVSADHRPAVAALLSSSR